MTKTTYRAGNDEITLADKFFELPYVKAQKDLCERRPKTLSFVKSHGDCIEELPKEAVLLGYTALNHHYF